MALWRGRAKRAGFSAAGYVTQAEEEASGLPSQHCTDQSLNTLGPLFVWEVLEEGGGWVVSGEFR